MRSAFLTLALGAVLQTPNFHSGVDVVETTVTVADQRGRFVAGLGKNDFDVFEDGRRRDIVDFADESGPVSLGILLDASGSMTAPKLQLARLIVSQLVRQDLGGQDEWLFARFGYRYLLRYASEARRDGRTHAIRVQVRRKGLTVRARRAFTAN